MNPAVQSAWVAAISGLAGVLVGVGGTTFVAIKGFRNTREATRETLKETRDATQKTLDAAREATRETLDARKDDRLWAKKADAYQDAMTDALQRGDLRQQVLDRKTPPEDALKRPVSQEWYDMQGRLTTFGAPEVVKAFKDSWETTQHLLKVHPPDTIAVTEVLRDDLHDAMVADDALVSAIRCDLGIEPVDT